MQLTNTTQINEAVLAGLEFDLFVGASGYETRAAFAMTQLGSKRFRDKVVFGFEDRKSCQREENDRVFARHGCIVTPVKGDSVQQVQLILRKWLNERSGTCSRILVDYTSMTRSWYAGIIEAIRRFDDGGAIECVFVYSPAEFAEPPEPSPNAIVDPIPGFCGLDVPEKPTALVIGLGYERSRALGLLEYIDPAVTFAFYVDPPLDLRFRDAVLTNNAAVLDKIRKDGSGRIFTHPLLDMQRTSDLLMSLYSGLSDEYRVILAPLGVKPFSLLCLLMASQFRDIDVWRVSAGIKAPPQDRRPCGVLLTLSARFE
jgi:hypothetical protein